MTPEQAVEALLHPGLAETEARHPHHRVLVDLAFAGHADIADDVGHGLGRVVDAERADIGAYARQLRRQHVEKGELPPGQALHHEHRQIAALAPHGAEHAVAVGGGDGDDAGERVEGAAEILGVGRNDEDAKALAALGDRRAEAVEDGAAAGRGELAAQTVLVREQPIFRRVEDLQLAEPPGEQAKETGLAGAEEERAPREALALLAGRVARLFFLRGARLHVQLRNMALWAGPRLPCLIQTRPRSTTGNSAIEARMPNRIGHQSIQRKK